MTRTDGELTVYYDGSCPLCRAEIGFYRVRQGAEHIAFHDVSDSQSDPAPDLDRETAMGRLHIRRPDGELVSGAAGFFEIWNTLPGWRFLGKLASVPGVLLAAEITYRVFLRLRPGLVKVLGPLLRRRSA